MENELTENLRAQLAEANERLRELGARADEIAEQDQEEGVTRTRFQEVGRALAEQRTGIIDTINGQIDVDTEPTPFAEPAMRITTGTIRTEELPRLTIDPPLNIEGGAIRVENIRADHVDGLTFGNTGWQTMARTAQWRPPTTFKIDFKRVNSLEDVIRILQATTQYTSFSKEQVEKYGLEKFVSANQ